MRITRWLMLGMSVFTLGAGPVASGQGLRQRPSQLRQPARTTFVAPTDVQLAQAAQDPRLLATWLRGATPEQAASIARDLIVRLVGQTRLSLPQRNALLRAVVRATFAALPRQQQLSLAVALGRTLATPVTQAHSQNLLGNLLPQDQPRNVTSPPLPRDVISLVQQAVIAVADPLTGPGRQLGEAFGAAYQQTSSTLLLPSLDRNDRPGDKSASTQNHGAHSTPQSPNVTQPTAPPVAKPYTGQMLP